MLRLATYNVLATAYIRASYYPQVDPRWLDPRWRTPALVERVRALEADVLCLQEVELPTLRALQEALPELTWHYLAKAKGQPDGCATAARQILSFRELVYGDGTGHVALLTEVAPGVTVANTHLKWDRDSRFAHSQLAELLERQPSVLCGDLNVAPGDPALAQVRMEEVSTGAATAVANGRARKLDYLFVRGLRGTAWPLPAIEDHTPLPSAEEPSDHLPLVAELE